MKGNVITLAGRSYSVCLDGDDGMLDYKNFFSVNCYCNEVRVHDSGNVFDISEKEKRLLVCLMNNITDKREIIQVVWHENHSSVVDNHYYQIVYRLRQTFVKNGLPGWLIKTISRYGVRLNINSMRNFPDVHGHDSFFGIAK